MASLNHVAFELPDLEAVMGNNVFAYFIAPFGAVIEYTAEIQEVGDDYRVGNPEDWKWPLGRIDHWGISSKDSAKIGEAERRFRFMHGLA